MSQEFEAQLKNDVLVNYVRKVKCNDNKISLNKDEKLSICTSFGLWGSVVVRVGISVTGHWPCLNVEMHEITG